MIKIHLQSNMRSHLLSALEKKKLVPFNYEKRRLQPNMKRAKKVKVKKYIVFAVYQMMDQDVLHVRNGIT